MNLPGIFICFAVFWIKIFSQRWIRCAQKGRFNIAADNKSRNVRLVFCMETTARNWLFVIERISVRDCLPGDFNKVAGIVGKVASLAVGCHKV